MNSSNEQQKEAILYTNGPLLVLAAAGSGKTRVITKKIAHLVNNCNIKANNIYATTFTNKASLEMEKRLQKILTKDLASSIHISSFHTLGLNILRKEYKTLNLKNNFSILGEDDIREILNNILQESYNGVFNGEYIKNKIHNYKNLALMAEDVVAENSEEELIVQVYAIYQSFLIACNSVDLDDLVLLPCYILKTHDDILHKWQDRIKYLLVDEYQDTNLAQYQLVKLLTNNNTNFTVVGDDDQSIYAFRGARPENLLDLQNDFPDLKIIKLELNYRSHGNILNCANKLISNNSHLFDKILKTTNKAGSLINIKALTDEEEEAIFVVNDLYKTYKNTGQNLANFAILYRSKKQQDILEKYLRQNSISYSVLDNLSFFDKQEIKDWCAYLRLIMNSDDNIAYTRIINIPRRKIGVKTIESLAKYANIRQLSLFECSSEIGFLNGLDSKTAQTLKNFSSAIKEAYQNINNNAFDVLNNLLEQIHYKKYLYDKKYSENKVNNKINNIISLNQQISEIMRSNKLSFAEVLSKILLRDIINKHQEQENNAVQLLTLHSSKGLEFKNVYIVGCDDEILPHLNSIKDGNIEEERRLLYVGITRAMHNLTLTYPKTRFVAGKKTVRHASRFLSELPKEEIQELDDKLVKPEQFRSLREMLK